MMMMMVMVTMMVNICDDDCDPVMKVISVKEVMPCDVSPVAMLKGWLPLVIKILSGSTFVPLIATRPDLSDFQAIAAGGDAKPL